MQPYNFFYFAWQCILVFVCGAVGLVALAIQPVVHPDVTLLFAAAFSLCIVTAVFFLFWMKGKRKQEAEDQLIDSIGESEN